VVCSCLSGRAAAARRGSPGRAVRARRSARRRSALQQVTAVEPDRFGWPAVATARSEPLNIQTRARPAPAQESAARSRSARPRSGSARRSVCRTFSRFVCAWPSLDRARAGTPGVAGGCGAYRWSSRSEQGIEPRVRVERTRERLVVRCRSRGEQAESRGFGHVGSASGGTAGSTSSGVPVRTDGRGEAAAASSRTRKSSQARRRLAARVVPTLRLRRVHRRGR